MMRFAFQISLLLILSSPTNGQTATYNAYQLLLKADEFRMDNQDSLLYYSQLSLAAAYSMGIDSIIAQSHNLIGIAYWNKGVLDSAESHYVHALDLNKRLENEDRITKNLLNLGMVSSRRGDYPKAIDYYLETIDRNPDSLTLSRCYNSLSIVYRQISDLTASERYVRLYITISEALNSQLDVAGGYLNLGIIFRQRNELPEAEKNYKISLGIFQRIENVKGEITSLNNLAKIKLKLKSYDSAVFLAERAANLSLTHQLLLNNVSASLIITEVKLARKEYNEALAMLIEIKPFLEKSNLNPQIAILYEHLGQAYFGIKKYHESASYWKKCLELQQKMLDESSLNAITNVRIAHAVSSKEKEIETLNFENQLADSRLLLFKVIFSLLFLVFVFAAITLKVMIKRKKEKHRQESEVHQMNTELNKIQIEQYRQRQKELATELESKNRQLSSYTLNLIEKNNIIKSIQDQLKQIKGTENFQVSSVLKEAKNIASSSLIRNKEWQTFRNYFEGAHSGFLNRLIQRTPTLTANERKLACLLRLDLSYSQISDILGISYDSLRVAKHRLSKKLGVDNNMILDFFISMEKESSIAWTPDQINLIFPYFEQLLESSETLDDLAWAICRNCISIVGLEDVIIYFLDEQSSCLVQKAAYGPKSPDGNTVMSPINIPVGKGICGKVAITGQPIIIVNTHHHSDYIVDDVHRMSELSVPIVVGNRIFGVIDSENHQEDFFDQGHLELFQKIAGLFERFLTKSN